MGKFKVGDKVRVLIEDAETSNLGIKIGEVGIVAAVYGTWQQPIEVDFDLDGETQDCCFDESELELVTDE